MNRKPDKPRVVILATAWGSSYGGINSFSSDLCTALSKLECCETVCVVNEGDDTSRIVAERDGIRLLVIHASFEDETFVPETQMGVPGLGTGDWVVGHDIHTGAAAVRLARATGAGASIIHHMDYAAYKPFEVIDDERKLSYQRETLSKADVLFGVGSKLVESAKDKTRENRPRVEMLIPGLAPFVPLDRPNKFSAITFGRLDKVTDRLKMASLSVAAFGSAVGVPANPLGSDADIYVIGLPEDGREEQHQELLQLARRYAGSNVPVHGWPYQRDRVKLANHLRERTVCMMLSLHEGFGLTGLEAISAEVPLIVSQNTGLYQTIDEEFGGEGTGCMHPVRIRGDVGESNFSTEDVEDVRDILVEIALRPERAKENARRLRTRLSAAWTWENTARALLRGLRIECGTSPLVVSGEAELADLGKRLERIALRGLDAAVRFRPEEVRAEDIESFCIPASAITEDDFARAAATMKGRADSDYFLPTHESLARSQAKGHYQRFPLQVFLSRTNRNVLLTGEPGEGKSTALWLFFAAQMRLFSEAHAAGRSAPLPLFLPLAAVQSHSGTDIVDQALCYVSELAGAATEADLIKSSLREHIKSHCCILILDAYDELPQGATDWLASEIQLLKNVRLVVSTRPGYLAYGLLGNPMRLRLRCLSPSTVREFTSRFFENMDGGSEHAAAIRRVIDEAPPVRSLSQIPLLLGLLCFSRVAEPSSTLAANRATVLRAALRQLLLRGDTKRGSSTVREARNRQKEHVLAVVADHFFDFNIAPLRTDPLVDLLDAALPLLEEDRPFNGHELLNEFVQDGILVRKGRDHYGFVLRSFHEYCLAAYWAQPPSHRSGDRDEHLIRFLDQPSWQHVWPLVCGLGTESSTWMLDALDRRWSAKTC